MHRLGLAMTNPSIKFKFSISIGYEDMKDDAKYRQWGAVG